MSKICEVCKADIWDSQCFREGKHRFCQLHYREYLINRGRIKRNGELMGLLWSDRGKDRDNTKIRNGEKLVINEIFEFMGREMGVEDHKCSIYKTKKGSD